MNTVFHSVKWCREAKKANTLNSCLVEVVAVVQVVSHSRCEKLLIYTRKESETESSLKGIMFGFLEATVAQEAQFMNLD